MSEISVYKNSSKIGEDIYNTNPFLKDLSDILEDSKIRNFFNTYIKDYTDIQSVSMFIKSFEMIEERFPSFNKYQKIFFVKSIIENAEMRQQLTNEILNAKLLK